MASFGLTIEDSSPLVSYSPSNAWTDSPGGDTLVPEYSGRSLHTTSSQGASATIHFSGTGFSLFGGKRPNYGTYSVTLDGQTLVADGSANAPEAATKQLLASAENLQHKEHIVVLSNTGTSPIDIDSLDIKCEIGNPGSQMTVTNYDDADSRITYLPSPSDWQSNTGDDFMDNTLHFSENSNAGASLTFTGEAIALYGTVAPDHADVRVTIDGREQTVAGGTKGFTDALHSQTLLWYADKLGQQEHTVVVNSVQADGTGRFLDIDRFAVFSASGGSPSNTVDAGRNTGLLPTLGITSLNGIPTSQPVAATSTRNGLPIAAIIGIAVGCFFLLVITLGCFFICRLLRRRSRAAQNDDEENAASQPEFPDPSLPFQEKVDSADGPRPTFGAPFNSTSPRLQPLRNPSRESMTSMIIPLYTEARGSFQSHSSTSQLLPSDGPMIKTLDTPAESRAPVTYQIPSRPSRRPPTLALDMD